MTPFSVTPFFLEGDCFLVCWALGSLSSSCFVSLSGVDRLLTEAMGVDGVGEAAHGLPVDEAAVVFLALVAGALRSIESAAVCPVCVRWKSH